MLDIEIPISSFLRFYEASPAHKVRMVQASREYRYNPQGYVFRDYYRVMRDTMRSHPLANRGSQRIQERQRKLANHVYGDFKDRSVRTDF